MLILMKTYGKNIKKIINITLQTTVWPLMYLKQI